ncbi:conserved protein of unknown function [Candidatus Promineifilum breve]|uniref:Orc1-like AAA ATPase domain-containing protein n=1 Tax=Candidatus Promineifilum breve TaxID=1806508 RepID=A0A160T0A1_9CHLR|nr:hypothetical protein [Candidatus Promineifilum breve]CUS02884.2 conserved protein of unknown function [Candidatus Promineifilum breve]
MQQRLEQARRRRFVGRESERELLRATLTAAELPFFVLHVFGPGGIGKTSLMREFAALAHDHGLPVALIDGRNVDPSPDSFLRAVGVALNLSPGSDPLDYLASHTGRLLLLVDTYELLTPIDGWLREQFLPGLRDDIFVVLAGRQPPALPWRTDTGWQALVRILPLRNLGPDESRAYLQLRGVPDGQIDAVLDFTHGHALALSLVADVYDQGPDTQFKPEAAPDVIHTLLDQLIRQVPSPLHRAALEATSLVKLMTESLLAALLAQDDVHDLFEWLRGLSFMEADRRGVFPHDLAREALTADIRWRNFDWFTELHTRARAYYMTRIRRAAGQEQRRILSELIYLHRENPSVRPFFLWQEVGTVFTDGMRPDDVELLAEMVERHEGAASAALAVHWLSRQPHNVSVLRGATGEPVGFLARVTLEATTPGDRQLDPAVAAAWDVLAHKPLRSGETALLFRFWMAAESYQSVSPEQTRLVLNIIQDYLITPGLAYTFVPLADPEFWRMAFEYSDMERLPEADFTVGQRRYGVYGHDWRVRPPLAWFELLAEREMNMAAAGPRVKTAAESLIVLSEADFATAVRDALRDYTDTAALTANPLVRSRFVLAAGGGDTPAARVAALRKIVRETAESLQKSPRLAKYYRAVYHTYFQPAMTQEQAAEVIDLPFSTYRRHLRSGIEELTARLWAREIGNLEN